jgi:hypothetical protein
MLTAAQRDSLLILLSTAIGEKLSDIDAQLAAGDERAGVNDWFPAKQHYAEAHAILGQVSKDAKQLELAIAALGPQEKPDVPTPRDEIPATDTLVTALVALGFARSQAQLIADYATSKGITTVRGALDAWNDRPPVVNASPDVTGPYPVSSLMPTDMLYLYALSVQPKGNGIFEALLNGSQDAVNAAKGWAYTHGGATFVIRSYLGPLKALAEAYLAR